MVEAAKARGYAYYGITDHSHYLREGRMETQAKEIDKVAKQVAPMTLLKGVEVNIKADGTLDVPDEVLAERDWVVASIHTAFDRDPTERILATMENPHVRLHRAPHRPQAEPARADGDRHRARGRRRRSRPGPSSRSTRSRTGSTCATCTRGWLARPACGSW